MSNLQEYIDDYLESQIDDEGPYAEYLMSFGYGDVDPDDIIKEVLGALDEDEVDDTAIELVERWMKTQTTHGLYNTLSAYVSYEHSAHLCPFPGSIMSMIPGEQEIDLRGYTGDDKGDKEWAYADAGGLCHLVLDDTEGLVMYVLDQITFKGAKS